jgi:autotransporter-associated beta strand protein
MKPTVRLHRVRTRTLTALLAAPFFALSAEAGSLSWDGANLGTPGAQGGAGTWNTDSTANWWNGTANVAWPALGGSDDDAVFGGTAGTVILAGTTVNDMAFTTTGYILSGASTLTLNGTTPTVTMGSGISATLGNGTATVLDGTAGLTKAGAGTLTISGSAVNTLTGPTTVGGGTLALQFAVANNASGVIGSGSALTLGGTCGLNVLGGATAIVDTQAFNGTTLVGGQATVALTKGTATSVTLNLGTLSNSSKSYLNFTLPTGTAVTTSHALDLSGSLLGTWASVGSGTTLTYAADNNASSGNITAYTGATSATAVDLSNVTVATTNYKYAAATTLAGNQTGNTLQYTGAATTTALGSNSLTLNGLMNSGTGLLTVSGTAGNSGLVIGAGGELDLMSNTQGLAISSVISGTGAVVYGGPSAGTLTLSGVNSYSGGTTLNAGILSISGDAALGAVPASPSTNLTFAGNSTLKGTGSFTLNANRNIVINSGVNATFDNPGLYVGIDGVISGAGSLTKTKLGTLSLNGMNTYTGGTYIVADNGGVSGSVNISSDASLGAVPASPTPNVFFSGGYQTPLTWLAPFDLNPNRTLVANGGSVQLAPFANQNITINNLITGSSSLRFTTSGKGSVTLANSNNSFAGGIILNGILKIGSDGAFGAVPASPTIGISYDASSTMQLLASFDLHPNRNIGGGTSGSGLTFTLDTQGFNMTVPGSVTTGSHKFAKSGSGTLTIDGNNVFAASGNPAAINGGLLRLNGSSTGGQLNINKNGALGGTGTISMAVTAAVGDATNPGGAIRLTDGAVGTLTLGSTLTFSGTPTYPNSLAFDLGDGVASDKIVLTTAGHSAAGAVGSALVYLNQLPGTTATGTYTLIQGGAASTFTGYQLATTRVGRTIFALGTSGNNLQVSVVGAGTAGDALAALYWKGDASSVWTGANWYSDVDGTTPAAVPGYSSNVRFATSTPSNLTNTLGQDHEINSLTVDAGVAAISIGGTNMLTLDATADNGNTLGNGITANNVTGTTLASKVGLASSQTWTVGSGATLTVSGPINDGGSAYSLTKADTGTLRLSGVNLYTGGTIVNDGILQIGTGSTTGAVSPIGGIANNATLTFNRSNTVTQGADFGLISGSGAVTQAGSSASILVLNLSNSYTGLTTASSGTLKLGAVGDAVNSPLGTTATGTTVNTGAALDLGGVSLLTNEALTLNGTGISSAGALINSGAITATYGGLLTLGSASSIVAGTTIILSHTGTITGDGFALTLGGTATGNSIASSIGTGAGTVTKSGAGIWNLSGTNTYSGGTAVNVGTLTYRNTAAQPASGTTTVAASATLGLGVGGAGYFSSTQVNALFANTLTLVTANATSIVGIDTTAGNFTHAASIPASTMGLTKLESNTLTLSGSNAYAGLTTISAGTLKLGGAGDVTNSPLGTAVLGTTVTSGAALDLGGFSIATAEALTLNGTGISSGGALTNSSAAAATYPGLLTLGSATSIVAGTGPIVLTHTGTITGAFALTLGGASTGSSLASILGTGAGTVTKTGAGTWTVSGASTYTGATTVSVGVLKLGAPSSGTSSPVGTAAAGTSVTSGAVLDLNGFSLATAEALTLNGTGISNSGALTNSSATAATYAGPLTLGSATSIVANSGNIILSNTGTITGAFALTLDGTATGSSVAANIATVAGTVTKNGTGTWTLGGTDTYTGLTTVSNGTLRVNGAHTGVGAYTVSAAGTLAGTGPVSGAVTAAGTLAPGTGIGTLTLGNTILTGTYACEIDAATADRLVAGTLNITGATLAFSILNAHPPTLPSYTIATYTGALGGTFLCSTVPLGYELNYATSGEIKLVKTGVFAQWAYDHITLLQPTADATAAGDPDKDGLSNLSEFAFGGDPLNGGDRGKIYLSTVVHPDRGPLKELVLTLAARINTPPGEIWGAATKTIDGITYTIEGSSNLTFPNGSVTSVKAYVTSPMNEALTDPAYEYQSFVLDGSSGLPTQGFLRAKVVEE